MKTPIIQNEPDEPSAPESRVEPPDESSHPTNLAGRMGRWSAQHRKTAIFGWLALRRRRLRPRHRQRHHQDRAGHLRRGRVGPHRQASPRGVRATGRRERAHPERHAHRQGSGLHGCGRRRDRQSLRRGRGHGRPVAARSRERGPDRPGRACSAHRLRDHRRPRRRPHEDRPRRRRGRRGEGCQSRRVHRLLRRQRRQGGRGRLPGRPQEGRAALHPGDAHHPHRRLRSARRGRHPAPARAHGHRRHVRAGRAADLPDPDRRGDLRADPAHRARGGRRLLDVLLEARTRGTCRRAQRGGGARGGGSHLGPLGADLRADRHHRHVRHVPRRRTGHVRFCPGHDPGGRGSHAGIAHGPPGDALLARRPRRARPSSLRQPAPTR